VAYYEWWCPRCQVTHPPGTRTCLHCGGRVQKSRDAAPAPDPQAALEVLLRRPVPEGDARRAPGPPAEDEEPNMGRASRVGMTVAWLVIALLATVARLCAERG
jgi:hypothetical protein